MTTIETPPVARELSAYVPQQYAVALDIMLALVPAAKCHFEVGNVHTAFALLGDCSLVQIPQKWGVTKAQMLKNIMLALPSTYQIGDMDPDFEP